MKPLIRLLPLALLAALSLPAQDDPGAPPPAPDRAPAEVFDLWPATPPEPNADVGEEIMLVERRRPFYQLTNVTRPTVSVYLPDKAKANGGAVMVYPGGGLVRLAIEHEGYEIADWLNSLGLAAFVVKYRVPPGVEDFRERYKPAVQDAQRAISLVRSRAGEWGIYPDEIGAIGFSAGGEVGTWLSLLDERLYDALDGADRQPLRPAFMLNIYPGGLAFGRNRPPEVREDIASKIDARTPPMFFVHAFSDDSMNSILMTKLLKEKDVPAELHIFQEGAHGFGARGSGAPLAIWTRLAENWMRALGFLDPAHVREFSRALDKAVDQGGKLPRLSALEQRATLQDGYRAQRRTTDAIDGKIVGYKGAMSGAAAQKQWKITSPLDCVLFESDILSGDAPTMSGLDGAVVETELAYVLGVDIATRIEDPDEARTATQAIRPALEIPIDAGALFDGKPIAADMVATNCGVTTRVVLGEDFHPDKMDPDKIPIELTRDGRAIHQTTGAATKNGQWENLMTLINQLVDQGRILREGDVIMSGAIGAPKPAEPGEYVGDYGPLGKVAMQIE